MPSTTPASGSGQRWGPLWGARPRDWAANEEQQVPTYDEAIRRLGIASGDRVLDVGCGSGVFLRLAADRGAAAFGLDASEALVDIARTRVPAADLQVGDMQFLPWEDDSFDVVTGFNSFFFAADMTAAVREAGRVTKPGAPVVIQVWGRPQACDLEAMKVVARRYLLPPPPGAHHAPELWKPGVLERIAGDAGLTPASTFDVTWAYEYPDDEALGRGMLAAGGLAELAGPDRVDALRAAILDALAAYRTPDGGYRLTNEYHYLVAHA